MEHYHLRRSEKTIADLDELYEVIAGQKYLTLALCREDEPYLVTLSYGFDRERNCFYFHCAGEGKKMDFWRANPTVWGQIVEDHGYLPGHCNHAFRSVQFRGQVSFLKDVEEKRRALSLMVEQLEPDPETVKAQMLGQKRVCAVTVGKIAIEGMSGKQNGLGKGG